MTLVASKQQAAARRHKFVTPGGATTFVSTYIGTNKMELLAQGANVADLSVGPAGPMAYLVEQEANSVVEPHFHEVPQFQLFVGGSGLIGTHRVEGVTIHYAGPHSPYGPIVAGPQGIQYVTLRCNWDRGAQWMPGASAVLRSLPGRKHVAFTSEPLQREAAARVQPVLDPDSSGGAGAWLMQVDGGQPLPEVPRGKDAFLYLLSGSASGEGFELAADSCLFSPAREPVGALVAGPRGAEAVCVQFPRT